MNIPRRTFLKLLSLFSLFLTSLNIRGAIIGSPTVIYPDTQTLASYLDTLIPADQMPSASQLLVTDKLLQRAHKNHGYASLLTRGCDWLDRQAQNQHQMDFLLLPEHLRVTIVALAETSEPSTLENQFYVLTRREAFYHYYAHPKSQDCLNYAGPPQPAGYMDHQTPPKHTGKQCQ